VSVGFLKVLNGGFLKSITVATFTESDINILDSAIAKVAAQGLVRYSKPLGGFFQREKASHAATLPLMLHSGFSATIAARSAASADRCRYRTFLCLPVRTSSLARRNATVHH